MVLGGMAGGMPSIGRGLHWLLLAAPGRLLGTLTERARQQSDILVDSDGNQGTLIGGQPSALAALCINAAIIADV